jgi:hypothetical protein
MDEEYVASACQSREVGLAFLNKGEEMEEEEVDVVEEDDDFVITQ